ncbi:hypothetical protein BJX65DRAFT_270262 [Aspergillus insuetus]
MTILADICEEQRRPNKAETLLVHGVEDEEQQSHPRYDTLDRQLRLTRVYWVQGKTEQAVKLENKTLHGSLQLLEKHHTSMLRCFSVKAVSQKRRGRGSEAVQLMARVTHIAEKALGVYHEDTLHYLHLLTA